MYNFAKANNSDVIFGKYVGVNGRGVPVSQFKKGNLANADIIKDNLIYTIAPHKMFKLAFLNANNLRFRSDVRPGDEDKLFVMLAYLEAAVISVLADYNYYYVVRRPGENLSVQKIPTDIELHFKPQRLILEHIDNSTKFNAVEKKNLKIAYINRWISFSILRTSLLSEKWGYDLSSQYFKGTKNIINRFLKRDDISRLSNPNRILAQNIISGTLESLRADDAAIKDPKRFVEFKSVNNKLLAKSDESFSFIDVDYLTKSQTMVNDVIAGDSGYVIDAVIEMESLKDVISGCSLIITNRKTQKEFVMEPFNAKNNLFLVPYSVLSEDGGPIFDIYLAAHVGPYTKRRRVGLQRSFNQLNLVSIDNEWIAYLTNGTDNVSLKEKSDSTPEVKKKGKFNIPLLGRK